METPRQLTDTALEQMALDAVRVCPELHPQDKNALMESIVAALKSVQNASAGSPSTPSGEPAAAANRDRAVALEVLYDAVAEYVGLRSNYDELAAALDAVPYRGFAMPICEVPTKDKGDEGLRGECSGPLPGRNVTVVQTGEKTLFVRNPKARE